MSFQELTVSYGIPQSNFLKYTAVRSALSKQWPSTPSEPNTSQVLHAIFTQGTARRTITMLYASLLSGRTRTLNRIRERWDADLSTPLSDTQWDQATSHIKEVSRNMRLRFTQLNYLHRTYLTPLRSPKCMQQQNQIALDPPTILPTLYIWYGAAP